MKAIKSAKKCAVAGLLAMVLMLSGCGIDAVLSELGLDNLLPTQTTEPAQTVPGFDYAGYDWMAHLEKEAFSEEGTVGQAVKAAAQVQVKSVTDSALTVTVAAPQITEELLRWFDAQDEFSGLALEVKIEELLKGKKQKQEFVLPYIVTDGVPVIAYPSDYVKALSCGVSDFYDILYARIMEQMGGTDNG